MVPLVGKSKGNITCAAEEEKTKTLKFSMICLSSCEDWRAKSIKPKSTNMKDCVTEGDRISLNPYRSVGEGEGGQASSSVMVIHTTEL